MTVIIQAQPLPVNKPHANTNHKIPITILAGSAYGTINPLMRTEIPTTTISIVAIVTPNGRDFSTYFPTLTFVYICYDKGFCN